MATLAELRIKVDSAQVKQGTEDLNSLANAANAANNAVKGVNGASTGNGGIVPRGESKKVEDLSAAIDSQTRKLNQLAEQRKKLESSSMKTTAPAEYERLNRIIEANISLVSQQGNAIDTLNAKQSRDTAKREASVAAELALQERLTRATERQELVVTNATAKQQRQIESTINGLDRQVKAVNEYNRVMETLNSARALSGMSSDNPQMSAAEYDSWVKKAAAQRDAALATADNSRETERAQRKLDTYTATLGKAERAEVEFARATSVLSEAQRLGLVTVEQYDQKLAAFASKRDAAVASANSNVAAEERFERQLRQVVNAYSPLQQAQEKYNTSVSILSQGLQSGVLSVDQFNKALTEQVSALDAVKRAESGTGRISSEYEDALRAVMPYRTELHNLEMQQRRLDDAKKAGMVTTPQQIKDYNSATAEITRQTNELNKRIAAGNKAGITYKQEQAALRGMPAQITDIVVSLQGGQAPLTVLLQQGGQIKDMFGGIGPAIRGMTAGIIGMINPMTIGLTTLTAFGAAAYSGSQEMNEFSKALTLSRGVSGNSASDFSRMAQSLSEVEGTTGKAAEALVLMEKSGKIAAGAYESVAMSAILMQKATGQAMDETIADFAALGKDPVDAAVRLDEKYRFLTSSVLAQAQALEEQGKSQEAVTLLQERLAEVSTDTAKRLIDDAGWIEQAWHGVKGAVTGVIDAMKNLGRDDTAGDELAEVQKRMTEIRHLARDNEAALARNKEYQQLVASERMLKARVDQEKQLADIQATREQNERKSVTYQAGLGKQHEANLAAIDKVAAAQERLNKTEREQAAHKQRAAESGQKLSDITLKQMDVALKADRQRLKEAQEAESRKGRRGAGPVDSRDLQEVKSNTAAISAEYDRYYKQITAMGEANVVSEEATFHSQMAILQAQKSAVAGAYDTQIAELDKLQARKGNTAAQSISLDNQMTKAEAARLKALGDIDSKMQTLQARETGRLQQRERNVKAYTNALREQVTSLEEQGERAVRSVGRGDRQAGVDQALADNDIWRAREERRLAEDLGKGMDPTEHAQKLKELSDAHSDMTDVILENDRKIQEANFDWTNGFTAAIENAQDAGMNFAGNIESALTGAFNTAGDALGTFVTTGKFNFNDFARSIVSDMAMMAAKQATMGAMGAVFNIAGAAFGGWMGGASSMGSTAAGYGPQYFAKGDAFEGGTPVRFAKGDAFTNSIVSTPTQFSMGDGRTGEIGEAGPEAVMPLTRTRDGSLGVRVEGAGGGIATAVTVNVYVTEGGTQTQGDGKWDGMGNQIGALVRQEVYTVINKETRPGGSIQPQGSRT